MKLPKIFIPEKDLTGRVNEYLNNEEPLRKKDGLQDGLHIDPNLNQMISVLGVILRLEGKSHRTIEQYLNKFLNKSEEDGCIYVKDFFNAAEADLPENINKTMSVHFKNEYNKKVKIEIAESYLNKKLAINDYVMDYVNMVIGIDSENLGPNNTWRYRDPKTGTPKTLTINQSYMDEVENRLNLKNTGHRESFREAIRKIYGMKISTDPYYNFMDNIELVNAVTDTEIAAEMNTTGIMIGSLTSASNEDHKQAYKRVITSMINNHGYCEVCAKKTIEHFCFDK